MYKVLIYILSVLICTFAISGINFNNFFKKEHTSEAKIFVFIIIAALGYLLGRFIIEFLDASKIL